MRPWRARPDLDRTAVRYFVYFLRDAEGSVVYVGRSCNVAQRLRAHISDASWQEAKAAWLWGVRSVDMVGPFTWDEAVARERAEIERHQPRGNVALTARDHRPAIAFRSALNARVT